MDLSLSNDNYTITIIDTNDSLTQITGFFVNPDTVTTTPTTEIIYHADTFCTANPTDSVNCPDGATRRATTLTQLPITTVIANGSDVYALTLRARDQYGNRVESGTIDVTYATTVKNIQTEDNFNYLFPICADAVNISTFVYACGEWRYTANLNTSDITYTITSTAPTNADNTIQLESIIYNITDIASLLWKAPLVFDPLFTASVSSLDAPVVNTPHTFQTDVTPDGTTTITPTVITTMQIGDGSAAEWRSLSSSPAAICSNYPLTLTLDPLCDWS